MNENGAGLHNTYKDKFSLADVVEREINQNGCNNVTQRYDIVHREQRCQGQKLEDQAFVDKTQITTSRWRSTKIYTTSLLNWISKFFTSLNIDLFIHNKLS